MRDATQILERIEHYRKIIKNSEKQAKVESEKLLAEIAKNVNDPIYIENWIDSWMREMKYCNAKINNHVEAIYILEWVLEILE